jgi:hypothetical protein
MLVPSHDVSDTDLFLHCDIRETIPARQIAFSNKRHNYCIRKGSRFAPNFLPLPPFGRPRIIQEAELETVAVSFHSDDDNEAEPKQ